MALLMITARFKVLGIVLLTIILVNLSHQSEQSIHVSNQKYSGSCASIGYVYSAKCCPLGESCEASDGNCKINVIRVAITDISMTAVKMFFAIQVTIMFIT